MTPIIFLNKAEIYTEIDSNLQMLANKFSKKGIHLVFDQSVKDFLFDKSRTSEIATFQKREIQRIVKDEIEDAVAEIALSSPHWAKNQQPITIFRGQWLCYCRQE